MPVLRPDQCYQVCKPVDLQPVLSTWDRLQFIHVNQGSPSKLPAMVVLRANFTPELNALIDSLGLGGRTARAILRKLAPRQSIPAHVDEWMPNEVNWRRFQVPLISNPEIKMRWPVDDVEVYLAPGFLYEVRFDRLHEVVHPADVERTHLQIDQVDATI
jgi:hypothetical protein